MSDAIEFLRDNYEFTDIGDLNRALAQAWDEGFYAATNGKWGPPEPGENPYRSEES